MREWISIKEHLPEELADVIVYDVFLDRIGSGWRDADGWYFYSSLEPRGPTTVTHWIPKPKLPEEKP